MALELSPSIKFWMQFFHPLTMWLLFAVCCYSAYSGIKIMQTRSAEGDAKKSLIQGKFNLKHYQVGALLLAFMVWGTIGGMTVTYLNNGKLFVGPHLIVGLAMTGLVAMSAALAPFMQKSQPWARYGHIFLNVALMGLFGWQAVTGMEIVQRILDKA